MDHLFSEDQTAVEKLLENKKALKRNLKNIDSRDGARKISSIQSSPFRQRELDDFCFLFNISKAILIASKSYSIQLCLDDQMMGSRRSHMTVP